MRPRDLRDWRALRRIADNSWSIVRFRKGQREGHVLEVRMREGGPLRLRGGRADFHMFHRIFLRDEYRLRTSVAAPLECVIDLGANVGLFAARVAPLARRVIAYEPFPENFAALQRNLARRRNVEAVCAAVNDRTGLARLFGPREEGRCGTPSLFADASGDAAQACVQVPTVTLVELFERHRVDACDLLKLDVEGAEYPILYGSSADTLGRIRRIHGEYHDVARDDPRTRAALFAAFLRDAGFQVELIPHRRKANHGHFFATRVGCSLPRSPASDARVA